MERPEGDKSFTKDEAKQHEPSKNYQFQLQGKRCLLIILCLTDFSSYLATSAMVSFFPSAAKKKGASETWTGLIFGTTSLVYFLISPVSGHLVNILGTRFMFLSGMLVSGLCDTTFAFLDFAPSGSTFIALCLLWQVVGAIGGIFIIVATYSTVVSHFKADINTVTGLLGMSNGVGMIVGPVIGGVFYSWKGFGAPFITIGTLELAVCLPLIYFVYKEDVSVKERKNIGKKRAAAHANKSPTFLSVLKLPSVITICVMTCVGASTWSFIEPIIEPHLLELRVSHELIALVLLGSSASYTILSLVFGYISDYSSCNSIMATSGLLMCSVCLFFLGPSPLLNSFLQHTLASDVVCLVLLATTTTLAITPTYGLLVAEVEKLNPHCDYGTYGILSGLWNGSYYLGELTGTITAGYLVELLSFPWATTVYAALVLPAAVITTISILCSKYREQRMLDEMKFWFPKGVNKHLHSAFMYQSIRDMPNEFEYTKAGYDVLT